MITAYAFVFATLIAAALPAQAAQSTAVETPTQVYLRFRATALNAKSIDEITAFWGGALMHEFSLMPDADKPPTLDIVKRMEAALTDVKVVKETSTASSATLTLEATGPDKKPMIGSVDLAKEDGAWKIVGQEQWRPRTQSPDS